MATSPIVDLTVQRPAVGIGLLVVRETSKSIEILLGKRKESHGAGEYGGPGGHLEYMESIEDSILRELKEEAGSDLVVTQPRFLCLSNLTAYSPKHYIDIGMTADYVSGEPIVGEPDKLESWDWYDIDNLPSPRFACLDNYVNTYVTGTADIFNGYFPS